MFKIDFSAYICYYLYIILIGLFYLWYRSKKPGIKQDLVSGSQIWQCSTCLYVYFGSKNLKISTCPMCGSFNQRGQLDKGVGG